jgi:hypothetical protein
VTFTILYEDKRGPTPEFGLHRFITACIIDAINGEYHRIEKCLSAHQCKGDSKLLAKCRDEIDDISGSGCPVIAVFDNDQVRRLLKLSPDSSDAVVRETIWRQRTGETRLCIVLLKENTESVLRAIGVCTPGIDQGLLAKAVDRKLLNERDIVFRIAAKASGRTVRDCVLQANPSLKEMVEGLCRLLTAVLVAAN